MAAIEPGKIRNVAVVGHRGTGKTSLVEALLYQTEEINRLGTVEAGTTVSDWDEDEQKRRMSISLTLAHTNWQGRKLNFIDVPGDPSFQGEARCALRVVEGALVVVNAVMGLEVGTATGQASRRRPRSRPRPLRQHARPRARRLLPYARADPGAVLVALRRRPPADRLRARADRNRRRPPHVRLHEPGRGQGGRADRDPRGDDGDRAGVPREAARRGRPDRRGADGAVPRRGGARRRTRSPPRSSSRSRRARCSPSRAGSRPRTSARTRCSISSSRAFRRRRRRARRSRSRERRRPRSCSRRLPIRSPAGSTSSASFVAAVTADSTLVDARGHAKERMGTLLQLQGKEHTGVKEFGEGDIGAVAKLKDVRTGDLLTDREIGAELPEIVFPEPVMSFAITPKIEGRGGEGRGRDPAARGGGPDACSCDATRRRARRSSRG